MKAVLKPETQDDVLINVLKDLCLDANGDIERPFGIDIRPSILNSMLFDNFIDEERFRQIVDEKLIELGKAEYDYLREKRICVDDGQSLHALGYALNHSALDGSKLRFEKGEQPETYMRLAEGLLDSVIKQLRTPNVRVEETLFHDPCSCPGC